MKAKKKEYKELWSKIRDLIRLISKNSDHYAKIYTKIQFSLGDEFPLNKMIGIPSLIAVVRALFFMKITNITHMFS